MPESARRRAGRPDTADAARLRGAIVKAAEAAFMERGFAGAEIEAIAAGAGTTRQTVYARFGSKEKLFIAVSDGILASRFPCAPPAGLPLREALIAVADQVLDAMLDPRMVRLYDIIVAEAKRFPALARLADEDVTFPGRSLMLAIIEDAAERGEILCDDPHRAMTMLQTMVLAAPLRAASLGLGHYDGAALKTWSRYAVDLFLDGLTPRGATTGPVPG